MHSTGSASCLNPSEGADPSRVTRSHRQLRSRQGRRTSGSSHFPCNADRPSRHGSLRTTWLRGFFRCRGSLDNYPRPGRRNRGRFEWAYLRSPFARLWSGLSAQSRRGAGALRRVRKVEGPPHGERPLLPVSAGAFVRWSGWKGFRFAPWPAPLNECGSGMESGACQSIQ